MILLQARYLEASQSPQVAIYFGIKMILMLLGLGIALPIMALKFGITRNALTFTALIAAIGFYLPGMNKSDLFKTVILDGALPRKTFSMGEAHEKRFYMEARKIV